MKNVLIALLLATASLPSSEAPSISDFAFMVRWERRSTTNSSVEESKRQSELLKQIVALILDYGPHEKLESAIALFLRAYFQEEFQIINAKSTPFFGKSKDEVFYILDDHERTAYVVKAFLHPETMASNFMPEFSGIALLNEKKMANLRGVEALGIGRCRAGGTPYGLLLEHVAPGKLVHQYILEIGLAQEPARSLLIKKASRMFYVIGQAFAQLHRGYSEKISFPEELKQKLRLKLEALDVPEVASKLAGKIDRQALDLYVEKVIEDALREPMTPCLQHGDAHWKNVFYEEKKELVTLIDTAKLHRTVDIEGNPLADGGYDLVRIQESLVRNSLRLMTYDEVQILIDALHDGYRSHQGVAHPAHIHFHIVYSKISRLSNYANYDNISDPIDSERSRLTFEHSLQVLQKLYSSWRRSQ